MRVGVLIFSSLREKLKWREKIVELDSDEAKIIEVIALVPELAEQIIENGRFKEVYLILLNGHNVKLLKNENTIVRDNDKIVVFPPGGGG